MRRKGSEAKLITGRKRSERRQLPHEEVDGDRPRVIVVFGIPVRGHLRLQRQRDRPRGPIREEGLQKHLIDVVDGSTMTGPAPQMIPDFAGEMKNEVVMSLIPDAATPPSNSAG
jgi:hypothetical protein